MVLPRSGFVLRAMAATRGPALGRRPREPLRSWRLAMLVPRGTVVIRASGLPGDARRRCPPEIQALPQPARARGPRVKAKPLGCVPHPQGLDRIVGHRRHGREWDVGQGPAIGPPEAECAVGLALDLVALLVHRAVMPATEQSQVPERGRPAVRPVTDMMPLAEPHPAAGEAAAPVPVVERAPQRRRDRPRPRPDLHEPPRLVVLHHHPARVARQTLRRFRDGDVY